jgi:hypothetical protein
LIHWYKRFYKGPCEYVGMAWVVTIAFSVFLLCRVKLARERMAEVSATRMARSPLLLAQTVLLIILLALMVSVVHLQDRGWSPSLLLGTTCAVIVALLLVRRALKWRYPI